MSQTVLQTRVIPYISLTKEEVLEFQQITLKLYNRKLSYDEAEDQLSRMVMMFELLIENKDVAEVKDHIEKYKKEEQNDNE